MKKINPHLLALMVVIGLYLLWWLSGGNFLGVVQRPSPLTIGAAFIADNFKLGAITVFESFYKVINK